MLPPKFRIADSKQINERKQSNLGGSSLEKRATQLALVNLEQPV